MENTIKNFIKALALKLIPNGSIETAILEVEKLKEFGVIGLDRLELATNKVIDKLPIFIRPIVKACKNTIKDAIREVVQDRFDQLKKELKAVL